MNSDPGKKEKDPDTEEIKNNTRAIVSALAIIAFLSAFAIAFLGWRIDYVQLSIERLIDSFRIERNYDRNFFFKK